MTTRVLRWTIVAAGIIVLAASNINAVEKQAGTAAGISPKIVADYLRAVIMAHRHFYTIEIVNRLHQERVAEASEDWRDVHGLPLPVQLLQETSEMAELTSPHMKYRLISQWPVNKASVPSTEFEREGLKAVENRPNRPYYGTFTRDGVQVFGAVYADRAITSSCIDCHNTHPRSPKSDFKLDDVMGGLVITFPLPNK